MKIRPFFLSMLLPCMFLAVSCSNNNAKADEPEILTMDSVNNKLEKSNKELEEKNQKLEASLEKLEKES